MFSSVIALVVNCFLFYKTGIRTFIDYNRSCSAFVKVLTFVGYFIDCSSSSAFVKVFPVFIKLALELLYAIAVVVIVHVMHFCKNIIHIPFTGQCVNVLLSHNKPLIDIY